MEIVITEDKTEEVVRLDAALPAFAELPLDGTALVMIDFQKDFLEPGGFGASLGNDTTPCREIVPTAERVLKAWRAQGLPVVHTLESHTPDLSDCPPSKLHGPRATPPGQRIGDVIDPSMGRVLVRGEPGNAIVEPLQPVDGEKVVYKPGKGAFYATDLEEHLHNNNVTHLIFAGCTTEVCVQTSMREACDRGFECVLLEDCTASYFPELKEATLKMVTAQGGIVGWTTTSVDLLAALPDEEKIPDKKPFPRRALSLKVDNSTILELNDEKQSTRFPGRGLSIKVALGRSASKSQEK